MAASAAPAPTTSAALPSWQCQVLAGAAQHLVDMRGSSREHLARRDLQALTAMFVDVARS